MFLWNTLDVGLDQNIEVVPGLEDINSIRHSNKSHVFQWESQQVDNFVEKDIGYSSWWSSNLKIINLVFEEEVFTLHDSQL